MKVSNAMSSVRRFSQYAAEIIGYTDKTEYDQEYNDLLRKLEMTCKWAHRYLELFEEWIDPNPTTRMEDLILTSMDKQKTQRMTPIEKLANAFNCGAIEIGISECYGSSLSHYGQALQRIGTAEREYITALTTTFLKKLEDFIRTEFKSMQREKSALEEARCDFDIMRNKLNKAKSENKALEAECEGARDAFEKQLAKTKVLYQSIETSHADLQESLCQMIEAQAEFHRQSASVLRDALNVCKETTI